MDLGGWDDTDSDAAIHAVRNGHLRVVSPSERADDWREYLHYQDSKGGKPKLSKHLANATAVLRYHPQWKGKICFDEHAIRELVLAPPWHEAEAGGSSGEWREWTDKDDSRLSSWLLRELGLELSPDACLRGVGVAADANRIHPFRDWLDGLTWDGVDRLDCWLMDHLGVVPSPYVALAGKWWMVALAARIYRPGCKADYVLVLEGKQGLKKSTALKTLAGERYFSDTPIRIGNKDAYLALPGRVIIELAEFKLDSKAAKDFFSSAVDRYRPPFGRREISVPRSCGFASTINPEGSGAYLTDETGGRRFWPVECGEINLAGLAAAREQLWAEAATRFKAGERWWPDTPEEHDLFTEEQAQRTEGEPWGEAINGWLATHPGDVTAAEVLKGALQLEAAKIGKPEERRAARVLREAGYRLWQVREGKTRTRVYRKV